SVPGPEGPFRRSAGMMLALLWQHPGHLSGFPFDGYAQSEGQGKQLRLSKGQGRQQLLARLLEPECLRVRYEQCRTGVEDDRLTRLRRAVQSRDNHVPEVFPAAGGRKVGGDVGIAPPWDEVDA